MNTNAESGKRVMLIAPHADDELFGAGGTLLRMKGEGYRIKLILMTCSDVYMRHAGLVERHVRRKEFYQSAEVLSTEEPMSFDLVDSKLDAQSIASLISKLDMCLDEFEPDTVFIPEPSYHQDHQVVNRACIAALRPTKGKLPGSVLAYEIPTSTGLQDRFTPNVYVGIPSASLAVKRGILKEIYKSQYSNDRGALTVRGMERHSAYRGVESGLEHAEAFYLIRDVWS